MESIKYNTLMSTVLHFTRLGGRILLNRGVSHPKTDTHTLLIKLFVKTISIKCLFINI